MYSQLFITIAAFISSLSIPPRKGSSAAFQINGSAIDRGMGFKMMDFGEVML